ncbi:MAG TPA: hypothetical protein VFR41_01305 [Acidimicrobiia bacterium]|nr:hypothetical protein [Acidimicrobiia bacterium]
MLIIVALIVVAFVGYARLRRHGESAVAHPSWQRTDEVFRDPSSGRIMRVWLDPIDGTRHYVPEGR